MNTLVSREIILRTEPNTSDREAVMEILNSTGSFYPHETSVAIELIDDRLKKGPMSEYLFIFADISGSVAGYICYGPITITHERFDIHWIVVRKEHQGKGIGGMLLREAEKDIIEKNGRYIFVDTSSRLEYQKTREFYRRYGYTEVARIPDYYADGDDKIVFMKNFL